MSKVIEISDSEEEPEQSQVVSSSIDSATSTPQSSTAAARQDPKPISAVSVAELVAITHQSQPPPQPEGVALAPAPVLAPASAPTTIELPTVSITDASVTPRIASEPTARKHSRRKSMHQPICLSPEIEFETIALDDDGETANSAPSTSAGAVTAPVCTATAKHHQLQQPSKAKLYKTTPKILTGKQPTTTEMIMDNACTELKLSDHSQAMLRSIAEDRVRVNFLLAAYNMPEIQFSLYTPPNVLQFQLEERVKQRRMRYIEMSRLQDAKRRRTLLQASAKTNN